MNETNNHLFIHEVAGCFLWFVLLLLVCISTTESVCYLLSRLWFWLLLLLLETSTTTVCSLTMILLVLIIFPSTLTLKKNNCFHLYCIHSNFCLLDACVGCWKGRDFCFVSFQIYIPNEEKKIFWEKYGLVLIRIYWSSWSLSKDNLNKWSLII